MTAQMAERLIYNGEQVSLLSNPLSDFFEQGGRNPGFKATSTALWRGYVGTWEITGDRLYLVELVGTLKSGDRANLETVFPGFPDRVFAHWFSGTLRIPQGKQIAYVHMGYQMENTGHRGKREIPGFWFDESELLALAFACRLLEELDPQQKLAPRLRLVIERLTASLPRDGWQGDWMERVRLFMPGRREVNSEIFDPVTAAVLQRRRIRLNYFTRSRGTRSEREVSPQRLIFQKAWYLDAYCHKVNELRRFSLDAIESVGVLDASTFDVELPVLERMFDGAYGAFPGEANRWATLLFSQSAAQWVKFEIWHTMQRKRWLCHLVAAFDGDGQGNRKR